MTFPVITHPARGDLYFHCFLLRCVLPVLESHVNELIKLISSVSALLGVAVGGVPWRPCA